MKGVMIAASHSQITPMNPYNRHAQDADNQVDETPQIESAEALQPSSSAKSGGNIRKGRGLRNQSAQTDEEELPPSKTKIKQQMHDLRDLGEELTELSKDQLAQLDIPDNLRSAINELKGINKFGAQRRQIQYIGKLMRDIDPAPILAKLAGWKGYSQQHTAHMHLLERWRERLLESDAALTELLAAYPKIDVQHLRSLIRNAHKESANTKPPKSFREIFQVLRDIIPESNSTP